MKALRKHTSFYLYVILVIAGLICLNTHSLTHLNNQQADSHQTTADPGKKISDNCVLCIVSAFGFADSESPQYIPDYSKSEIVANLSTPFLSKRSNPVTVPRAPPFV